MSECPLGKRVECLKLRNEFRWEIGQWRQHGWKMRDILLRGDECVECLKR